MAHPNSKIANIPAEMVLSGFRLIPEFRECMELGIYDFEHPLDRGLSVTVDESREDCITARLNGTLARFWPEDGDNADRYVGRVVEAIQAARERGGFLPEPPENRIRWREAGKNRGAA